MLSKFSKQGFGLVITAGALGFGLFIGSAGPSRAQDKAGDKPGDKPAAPTKNWKDNAEYELALAAQKETDPVKKIAALDKWKAAYPSTEFVDDRQGMYLLDHLLQSEDVPRRPSTRRRRSSRTTQQTSLLRRLMLTRFNR